MSSTLRTPYRAATERIQFIARAVMLVFLAGWVSWFFPFDDLLDRQGTPLGADFAMFYVAGRVANEGRFDRMYDQEYQQHELHRLFPQLDAAFCLPYRYPPWVALLTSSLARLPYALAFALFLGCSLAAGLLTLHLLMREFRGGSLSLAPALGWAMAGWPVALETLIGGQASLFGALIAVATFLLLSANRPVAAGVVLGFASYKPNVLALFALGVAMRSPRVLLGIIPVALGMVGLIYVTGGISSLNEYLFLLVRLGGGSWDVEPPFWKVHGLSSWIAIVTPHHARSVTFGLGIMATMAVAIWWRIQSCAGKVVDWQAGASLIVVNSLFNPYVPIYDLVLLAPAAAWVAAAWWRPVRRRAPMAGVSPEGNGGSTAEGNCPAISAGLIQLLFATLFFGPHLSQALARSVGVQLFPLALLVIAVWVALASVAARFRGRFVAGDAAALSSRMENARAAPQTLVNTTLSD